MLTPYTLTDEAQLHSKQSLWSMLNSGCTQKTLHFWNQKIRIYNLRPENIIIIFSHSVGPVGILVPSIHTQASLNTGCRSFRGWVPVILHCQKCYPLILSSKILLCALLSFYWVQKCSRLNDQKHKK